MRAGFSTLAPTATAGPFVASSRLPRPSGASNSLPLPLGPRVSQDHGVSCMFACTANASIFMVSLIHHVKNGMFFVQSPVSCRGPFESLSDAMSEIEHRRIYSAIPPRPMEYFILKDGLFHIHPLDLGGPFARLDDACAALQMHWDSLKPHTLDVYWKDAMEKARNMQKWLNGELDSAYLLGSVTSPQNPKPHKFPEEDLDFSIDDFEPEIDDPDVLKVLQDLHGQEMEEEITRDGMLWMENDATKAFKTYLSSTEKQSMKDMEYMFHKLDYQCLIYDGPNIYHHYNFTMNIKLHSKKHWEYHSYFAEVKFMANGKQYFCYPVEDIDDGHCFGCHNVGIKLRHPANGGYEERVMRAQDFRLTQLEKFDKYSLDLCYLFLILLTTIIRQFLYTPSSIS